MPRIAWSKAAVIRLNFQSKLVAIVILSVGAATVCLAAQADQTPPKELIEYVHQAKQQGQSDADIQKKAAAIGWPEAVVKKAIAYEASGKPLPASPMTPKEVAITPPSVPAASFDTSQTDPAATAGTPEKAPAPPRGGSDDYLLGAGDTLQVAVFKDPDLSVPSVMVRPDGRITLPLVKEVAVAGMTERQAEAAIATAMSKFVTDPVVTVVVTLPTSKKVYMVGAVRKEGTLPYTYGMTIMQAISEAGGLNDYAKKTKIYVLRTENGREYRLEFNYKEVLKGERMEQNIMLLPGDTVVIPQ
jgi:polysaccharide export outer membrane protein